MLRALTFILKVGALVALAVWLTAQQGTVRLEWMNYVITLKLGFFLLLALVVLFLAIFIYRIIHFFTSIPRNFRRHIQLRRQEKGYRALTRGLAAVAAGDVDAAVYQAKKTRDFLPADNGLPLLLQAQAARLEGREEDARQNFLTLAEHKDAGFLGLRGLLQSSLDERDHEKALDLARQALALHPRQPWILKLSYDLEIKERHWEEAKKILFRAEKTGAIAPAQAASDHIAILLAQAEDDRNNGRKKKAFENLLRAWRYHPYFPPAALRLARFYKENNKRHKAAHVVERTWRKNPHPDLARLWDLLIPPGASAKPMARLMWFERLAKLNPGSAESHLAAGRVAMEEGLWGEARARFQKAEAIEPSGALYRLWGELERKANADERVLRALREKASGFPVDKRWICRETGAVYDEWSPVADSHGAFNTITWDYPRGFRAPMIEQNFISDTLIEAPQSRKISA